MITQCTRQCNRTSGGSQEDPFGTLRLCSAFIGRQLKNPSIKCVEQSMKFLSPTSSSQCLMRGLQLLLRASLPSAVAEVGSSPTWLQRWILCVCNERLQPSPVTPQFHAHTTAKDTLHHRFSHSLMPNADSSASACLATPAAMTAPCSHVPRY